MHQPLPPSIFNDVIGPVMRGPSSSHCAAALRIGRMVYDVMGGSPDWVKVTFDPRGSLATTHESQGSDMGFCGGVLDWDAADERLPDSVMAAARAGVDIRFEVAPIEEKHANAYEIEAMKGSRRHRMTALSTGGGMVTLVKLDDVPLHIQGDYFVTLVMLDQEAALPPALETSVEAAGCFKPHGRCIQINSRSIPDEVLLQTRLSKLPVKAIHRIRPVLPVLSSPEINLPFSSAAAMLQTGAASLSELALQYESARSGLSEADVLDKMLAIVSILDRSVASGLEGTEYADRILPQQSDRFQRAMSQGRVLNGGMLNLMTLYVTALMEVKSSMGVIVAAPTAGSCGGLPGAVLAAAEFMGLSAPAKARALLAGGLVGVLIAQGATFAAELGGCQVECGAGSGMAAAALAELAGGTVEQALAAASMALQNSFGMTCDPVANRVEVPCLGKNVMAAANGLTCANMALSGFDEVVPLDEVIDAMNSVGRMLPMELRCTALGGLSVTPSSLRIEKELKRR